MTKLASIFSTHPVLDDLTSCWPADSPLLAFNSYFDTTVGMGFTKFSDCRSSFFFQDTDSPTLQGTSKMKIVSRRAIKVKSSFWIDGLIWMFKLPFDREPRSGSSHYNGPWKTDDFKFSGPDWQRQMVDQPYPIPYRTSEEMKGPQVNPGYQYIWFAQSY